VPWNPREFHEELCFEESSDKARSASRISSSISRHLEGEADILATLRFSHPEDSQSLCKLCSSISFKALASSDGFDHQCAGRKLREEYDCQTGCALCSLLWKALLEDLNQTYTDDSNEIYAKKHGYRLYDGDDVFRIGLVGRTKSYQGASPYDEFPTLQTRLPALERDPVKLFLNPLQDNHVDHFSDVALEPYKLRSLSVWSANPEMMKKIDWHHDRY
jgi:hypothetical protein